MLTNAGTSSFNAGAHTINLSTSSNSFSGAVLLDDSGANAVSITNSGALSFGASSVGSSTLGITSGGTISETGAITSSS